MTTKDRLHRLVDELPDDEARAAERYLLYLRDTARDPVLRALLEAEEDDESETDDERAAVEAATADVLAGRLTPLDEVKRELGL